MIFALTNSGTISGGKGGVGEFGAGGAGGAGVENAMGGTITSLANNAGATIRGGDGETPTSSSAAPAAPAWRTPAQSRR